MHLLSITRANVDSRYWSEMLHLTDQGQKLGAAISKIQIKWGQGKTGPELMSHLGSKVSAIADGLKNFRALTPHNLRTVLDDALQRNALSDPLQL